MDAEDRRLRDLRPYNRQPRWPGTVLDVLHVQHVRPAQDGEAEHGHPRHHHLLLQRHHPPVTRPYALTATTTGSTCTGVAAQYTYDDTGNTE
ncbi:hypothetical protein AB0D78_26530 [Streptomyces avermitilis]|uniref:hypothetical protein n=1 Tax=Streptomyces avermitilis TaxID=33903 RepID=UPI00340CD87B